MSDVYGDIIDADTIEQAVKATLEDWLPGHLAHQERRRGLTPGTLPQPKSWPLVSEFDIEVQEQLPAIVIVSPGGRPIDHDRGRYRKTFRFEIAAVLGARNEREARKLAGLYLAAVIGALAQNPTLGDVVEKCQYVGPDDHAFGTTGRGAQRAIYGTAFDVTVRDAVDARLGPSAPPPDPYDPEPIPPGPNTAEIVVTYMEDTP